MSDVGGIEALMRAAAETEYRARLYGRWKPMDPGRGRGAHGGVRSSVVGGRRLGDQSATAPAKTSETWPDLAATTRGQATLAFAKSFTASTTTIPGRNSSAPEPIAENRRATYARTGSTAFSVRLYRLGRCGG